jgi:tRNA(adenine34) deaminase
MMTNHTIYMRQALREAKEAFAKREVPVGAVVVYKGKVIARAHNQIKLLRDPTAHAEMIALTQAANFFKNERLPNTSVYVTIEPCSMGTGARILARAGHLIYGASDPKTGACGSVTNIANNRKLNHRLKVTAGVLEEECSQLLKEFFKKKRTKD